MFNLYEFITKSVANPLKPKAAIIRDYSSR